MRGAGDAGLLAALPAQAAAERRAEAWRHTAAAAAGAIYEHRAATAELVNAQARNRGLIRLLVRGRAKVKAVLLWFALAHNMAVGWRLAAPATA